MWTELGAALALMLVLEGILPFLSPDSVRRLLAAMSEVDNRSMRISGLVSMLAGVGLLYLVR
ncbi:MAG: DUF2065 domain-containing protein [Thiogranum sp.]|jgi:hypothetical protein|nr:DUF2065 domain-containing protein [Thiogranum sp.]